MNIFTELIYGVFISRSFILTDQHVHLNFVIHRLVFFPKMPQHVGGRRSTRRGFDHFPKADFTDWGSVVLQLSVCTFLISEVIP